MLLLGLVCLIFGVNMEAIFQWGPWMDLVSIYIIPLGAMIGAISWFWIMRRDCLLQEINRGAQRPLGTLWYTVGRYVYVPITMVLCAVALSMKIAF